MASTSLLCSPQQQQQQQPPSARAQARLIRSSYAEIIESEQLSKCLCHAKLIIPNETHNDTTTNNKMTKASSSTIQQQQQQREGRDIYFECIPFASGGQRLAFYGYYDKPPSSSSSSFSSFTTPNLVIKLDMATSTNHMQPVSTRISSQRKEAHHTIHRHETTSSLINKWHSLGVSKTIIILEANILHLNYHPPSVITLHSHGLHNTAALYEKLFLNKVLFKDAIGTVEDYVPGQFTKFLNNDGSMNPRLRRANFASAFAHWTWHVSGNKMMVSDIQGVRSPRRYVLTDPAVHSVEEEDGRGDCYCSEQKQQKFGINDLGILGIKSFFEKHQCNDLCKDLNLPHISSLTTSSSSSALAAAATTTTRLPVSPSTGRLGRDFNRNPHHRHAAGAASVMPQQQQKASRRRIRPVFRKRRLHYYSGTQTDGSDHASLSAGTTQSPCDSDTMVAPNTNNGMKFEPVSSIEEQETDADPDNNDELKTKRKMKKRLTDTWLVRATDNAIATTTTTPRVNNRVTVEGKTTTAVMNLSDESDDDDDDNEWKCGSVIDGFPATRVNQDDLKMFGQRRRHHTNNRTANVLYITSTDNNLSSSMVTTARARDSPCAIANTNGLFNDDDDDDEVDDDGPVSRKGLAPALGSGIPSVGLAARGFEDRTENTPQQQQQQPGVNMSYVHIHNSNGIGGGRRRSMWLFGSKRASLRDVMQASASSISGDFSSSTTGQQQATAAAAAAAREGRHATRRGTGRVKQREGRKLSWRGGNNMTGNHRINNVNGCRGRVVDNNNAPATGHGTGGARGGQQQEQEQQQRKRQSGGRTLLRGGGGGKKIGKGLKAALIGRLSHVGGGGGAGASKPGTGGRI